MTERIKTVAFFFVSALLFSCGGNTDTPGDKVTVSADTAQTIPAPKEDSLVTKIRPLLFDLENQELSFNGRKPFDLTISDISYTFISLKQYYTEQQSALAAQVKYSTNKEKTGRAMQYLTKMIQSSGNSPEIYKTSFHLKAKVDKTIYDEQKILYLKKDLSLLELIFPQ